MAISRVTAVWTGFSGAPGYTNFFFNAFGSGDFVDEEVGRVRDFFDELTLLLPEDVTVQVQQEAALLDEASGALIGYSLAETNPLPVEGTQTTPYSAPSGAAITWNTDAVARGRRLRGRTFIVPIASGGYEDDGTLSPSAIGYLSEAANALLAGGEGQSLVIWSRPRDGAGGTVGTVNGFRVADRAAILRSRRD